jgi:hypothetical protein
MRGGAELSGRLHGALTQQDDLVFEGVESSSKTIQLALWSDPGPGEKVVGRIPRCGQDGASVLVRDSEATRDPLLGLTSQKRPRLGEGFGELLSSLDSHDDGRRGDGHPRPHVFQHEPSPRSCST